MESVQETRTMSVTSDSDVDSGVGLDTDITGEEVPQEDGQRTTVAVPQETVPSSDQIKKHKNSKTGHQKVKTLECDASTKQRKTASKKMASTNSRAYPDLNIPDLNDKQRNLMYSSGEGQVSFQGSKVHRKVTQVRNTMYGNFLRQSTKKLQDDLRQTMRTYSSEKQQLLRHLASLRHEMDELRLSSTASPTSTLTDRSLGSDSGLHSKPRRYYMAPNIAAHKLKKKKRKEQGQKVPAKAEVKEDKRPKEGILKLPSIQEANPACNKSSSEWDSGQQISLANLPPIDPPAGIAAAQALLQDSYKIPTTEDPDRTDISLDNTKTSLFKEKKKVQFSEKNRVAVITPFHNVLVETSDQKSSTVSKNYESEGSKISPRNSKGRNHHLPPIDLSGKKSLTPRETEDHKLMYISIKDPEIRTKTLSEILHAVRVRMQENEQHLKYFGMTPPRKINNTYEFLVSSSMDRHSPIPRSESQRSKASSRLGGPQHTAARLGRRSHAVQLQNYLKKMSKSRRMIEHMEAEEYRLAHFMGHKELMAVSKSSSPIPVAS